MSIRIPKCTNSFFLEALPIPQTPTLPVPIRGEKDVDLSPVWNSENIFSQTHLHLEVSKWNNRIFGLKGAERYTQYSVC